MRAVGICRLVLLMLLASAACFTPVTRGDTPGLDVAEIVFDKAPIQHGMGYDGYGVKYTRVTLASGQYDAWMAEKTVDKPWERTWRLKVNDPRLMEGKRPVVDIDITYHLPGWGSVEVFAATVGGKSRHVGGGWGNSNDWKTMHLELDDSFFSNAEKDGGLGPFDLRITGSNAPVYLKKVRLTFYNPTENVHWDRMLQIRDLAGETPGGVLAFTQNPSAIKLNLNNLAFIDRPVHYRFRVQDSAGKALATVEDNITLTAQSSKALRLPFDPAKWPLGPYKANFEVLLDDKPVLVMPLRMGVVSGTTLEKARNDEFFYGLDPANGSIYHVDTDAAAAYYRLMGVDFLRRIPLSGADTPENIKNGIDFLAREQLRAAHGEEPPRPDAKSGVVNAKELDKRASKLADIVRSYAGRSPGHVCFLELGNEPDMTMFWPADVKLYNDGMNVLADGAIAARTVAGLKPSDCPIANGGLAFAGSEGDRRARQLVALFDPSKLDMIAYHGHGPGIAAERAAFERLQGARAKTAVADLPAIETESGVSASSELGLLDQARTAVEKMVYAQSVKLPGFVFFRLFMEGGGIEGGYGMTDKFIQPRPSVLSYRNMVERLRHRRFVRTLDAAHIAGVAGVDLYLFEETQPDGQPSGRKTIVGFAENTTTSQMAIRLDDPKAKVSQVELFDMFGNARPVTQLPGNVVLLPISRDSAYLSWNSAGPSSNAALIPPLLTVNAPDALLEGADTSAELVVRNPGPDPMKATLALSATGSPSIAVQPAAQTLEVPPFGQAQVPLTFHVASPAGPLEMPRWWRVFPDADPAQLADGTWTSLPSELKKRGGGAVAGQQMFTADNRLEFTKPFGNAHEHRPVIAMAYIDCPQDTTFPAAASADWWMDWYLNGKLVYTTKDTGNLGGTLADHTFNLPLKAGRNIVAFHCGSGSQGWSMKFGGPRQRQRAVPGLPPLDRLQVTLTADARPLADLVLPLDLTAPIPSIGQLADPSIAENWNAIEPFSLLDADTVHNLFFKEPDAARWYHGSQDLSATIWLRDDAAHDKLHIMAVVKDDKHVPAKAGEPVDQHDSLHCVLADEAGHVLTDLILAADSTNVDAKTGVAATATRAENALGGPTTCYYIVLPRGQFAKSPFRLNLRIADDDGFGLKQTTEVGDVTAPQKGVRLRLP